jgi:hypothetical protein
MYADAIEATRFSGWSEDLRASRLDEDEILANAVLAHSKQQMPAAGPPCMLYHSAI